MRQWLRRLLWGDVCKKCRHRMGRHYTVRVPHVVRGEHVDRTVKVRVYNCPEGGAA